LKRGGKKGGAKEEMTKLLLAVVWAATRASAFNVAIVGAHGGLGRELSAQSLDRGWEVTAFVRRPCPIFRPCRVGGLSPDEESRILEPLIGTPRFHRRMLFEDDVRGAGGENQTYDAIVFALGGRPFSNDRSEDVVARTVNRLPPSCGKVCLVSAYGAGESIRRAGVGIRAMESVYLRDVYRSKREQEELVCGLPLVNDRAQVSVVRPRVLSYSPIPLLPFSITRERLAGRILDWIAT
jgi:hypothetical protein